MDKTGRSFLRRFKIFFVKKVWIEKLIIIVLINPTLSNFFIEKIISIVVCTIVLTNFLVQSYLRPLLKNPNVVLFLIQKTVQIVIFIIKDFCMINLIGFLVEKIKNPRKKNTIVHFRHLYSLIKIGLPFTVLFLGLIDFFNITEALRVFFYTPQDGLVVKYIPKTLEILICAIKVTNIRPFYVLMVRPIRPDSKSVYSDFLTFLFQSSFFIILILIQFVKLVDTVPPDLPSDSFVVKYLTQDKEPESRFRMAMYLVWLIRDNLMIVRGRKYLWDNTPIDDFSVHLFLPFCLMLNFPLVWILYSIADPAK